MKNKTVSRQEELQQIQDYMNSHRKKSVAMCFICGDIADGHTEDPETGRLRPICDPCKCWSEYRCINWERILKTEPAQKLVDKSKAMRHNKK